MRNIIITGGGFVNKGAEAMTYITVSELKSRFPDHKIYLLSPIDYDSREQLNAKYTFNILGWYPMKFAKANKNPILRMINVLACKEEYLFADSIYRNTDLLVDISGYALGSNWSLKICSDYLDCIEFAQYYDIPIYLMPQSFGPFDFEETYSVIDERIKTIFPKIKKIFVREADGYKLLNNKYHLENIALFPDVVLSNKFVDLNNVFTHTPKFSIPQVEDNSVAVIPNDRIHRILPELDLVSFYSNVIETLLKHGKNIYLIAHSSYDLYLCSELKKAHVTETRVKFFERDFNCTELEMLTQKFEFVIASRYHSIVHSFKHGIPCIAIGWADKYADLMNQFNQGEYILDVRNDINKDTVSNLIYNIDLNKEFEHQTIDSKLLEIQKSNAFDLLEI